MDKIKKVVIMLLILLIIIVALIITLIKSQLKNDNLKEVDKQTNIETTTKPRF